LRKVGSSGEDHLAQAKAGLPLMKGVHWTGYIITREDHNLEKWKSPDPMLTTLVLEWAKTVGGQRTREVALFRFRWVRTMAEWATKRVVVFPLGLREK
jgi:hypothetical protein